MSRLTTTRIVALPPTLVPGPGAVAERFSADLGSGMLAGRALTTVKEATLGCLLAMLVALPAGYLVARSRVAEAAISPYLAASQALPAIALAPLLVLWVGYGLLPIVILCALIVFFPMLLTTVLGLRSLPPEIAEAAVLDGATGWLMIRYVEEPLARPAVLTGLRNGFTLSITGAVVGEFVMGGDGLGMIISAQAAAVDTTGVFATIVMLCLLAIVAYLGMLALEWLLDPLRPTTSRPRIGPSTAAARVPPGTPRRRGPDVLSPGVLSPARCVDTALRKDSV
ncbi:MAG: ABC transporter permease [Micrococcales bacterium]|nr:MAG: ABC transporter permease [Micrococcales bacterium]